jgi:signal transduction histidine kinase
MTATATPVQRWRAVWVDAVAAVGVFAAMTADVGSTAGRHAISWYEVVVIGLVTLPLAGRRRAPLGYAAVTMVMAIVLAGPLGQSDTAVLPVYATLVPAYTVAAYCGRRQALAGLAICLPGVVVLALLGPPTIAGYLVGVGMCIGAWLAGRWMNGRNALVRELGRQLERLASERHDRERLAVADEQARIARALHEAVAERVSSMVVEAAAAQLMLLRNPGLAEDTMEAIELSGRAVMEEMRHLLGALRATDETATLAPQPGVGQLHALLGRPLNADGSVTGLRIEGEPGQLPASVDLALYRLVEEALGHGHDDLQVTVRFGAADVELTLTAAARMRLTPAMRERIAFCGGSSSGEDHQLVIRLPRVLEGALA